MKNWFGCASFVVLLIMGACVFVTAQRMHQAQTELQKFNHDIAQERDHLRVLQAEWAYLNNPDRLEKIATMMFGLQPQDGKQYVATANMPTRASMEAIEIAQNAKDKPANDNTEQQQLAAASIPADDQAVDKALTLAAATASQTALPNVMPVSLTTSALGDANAGGVE